MLFCTLVMSVRFQFSRRFLAPGCQDCFACTSSSAVQIYVNTFLWWIQSLGNAFTRLWELKWVIKMDLSQLILVPIIWLCGQVLTTIWRVFPLFSSLNEIADKIAEWLVSFNGSECVPGLALYLTVIIKSIIINSTEVCRLATLMWQLQYNMDLC